MPTLTIGRFSMSDGPTAIRHDGNNLDLDLQIDGATTSDPTVAKVLRQQLLGLAENDDEKAVPVTWSDDSDIDGYYFVEGVSVEPFEMYLNNGTMTASVSLRRITGGFARPQLEITYIGAERTNSHALAERIRVAVPTEGQEVYFPTLGQPDFLTTETGTLFAASRGVLPESNFVRYQAEPADYYNGSARIEVLIGGTYRTVVGRQIPAGWSSWRLNNGLVRVTPTEISAGNFALTVEGYDGDWNVIVVLDRGIDTAGAWTRHNFASVNPLGAFISATNVLAYPIVTRNSPERCVITIPQYDGWESYEITRGDAYFVGRYEIPGSADEYGIGSNTAVAVTDSVGYMVRTSVDANGFKFFASTPATNTVDTANAQMYLGTAATSFAYACGFSTPITYQTHDEALYALAAVGLTQKVSTR